MVNEEIVAVHCFKRENPFHHGTALNYCVMGIIILCPVVAIESISQRKRVLFLAHLALTCMVKFLWYIVDHRIFHTVRHTGPEDAPRF